MATYRLIVETEDVDELQPVLAAARRLRDDPPDRSARDGEPETHWDAFVGDLTEDGVRAVHAILRASRSPAEGIAYEQLARAVPCADGVLAGVSAAWGRNSRASDPFVGRWDAKRTARIYFLPRDIQTHLWDRISALDSGA